MLSGWNQLEGKRCPLFGRQKHTTILIEGPSPGMDHFSVQFAFDHGRYVTPWLQIIGNKRVRNPFIHVELVKTGNAITGVHAKVLEYDERTHHVSGHVGVHHSKGHMKKVYEEFHDPNTWPKHVLVKYTWTTRHETDVEFALFTLMSITVLGMVVVGIRSMSSYRNHIKTFFMETVMDEPTTRVPPRQIHHSSPMYHHHRVPHVGQVWVPPPAQGPKAD